MTQDYKTLSLPSVQEGEGEYGLIGFPLGHSFSRGFFTEQFARQGIRASYANYEITDASMLLALVAEHPHLKGLNCTIPHKQAIIPLLDELSDEARQLGAVNVIRITRDDSARGFRLKGFNSDIIGFMDSIRPLLQPHHRKALILGTGGASKAVRGGLEKLGLEWRYVSRTPREGQFTYNDIDSELLQEYQVIVNCSPVGMYPHTDEAPALPYEAMGKEHLLYDLVYNPLTTRFMELGAAQGATVKNGLEMLYLQAIASWRFWHGEE